MNSRYRPIIFAVIGILAAWLIAWGGFAIARNSKMTAEKLQAYMASADLGKLTGENRKKFLQKLADKLNALSPEERRKSRGDQLWASLFAQMTEQEKEAFLDATMPTRFKQMLDAFEQMPEEKRRKAIDDAVKRMREARANPENGSANSTQKRGTNAPVLSEDLQKKAAEIGLKTFYSQSSAQAKAELAPLLEENQRNM
jgi:hypothetical protein